MESRREHLLMILNAKNVFVHILPLCSTLQVLKMLGLLRQDTFHLTDKIKNCEMEVYVIQIQETSFPLLQTAVPKESNTVPAMYQLLECFEQIDIQGQFTYLANPHVVFFQKPRFRN